MNQQRYTSTTGQSILSEANLDYALTTKEKIDLSQVRPADLASLIVLPNEKLTDIYLELTNGKSWRSPSEVLDHEMSEQDSHFKNFCIIHEGTISILNGTRYTPLQKILSNDDPTLLKFVIQHLAHQAAVCQAALAGINEESLNIFRL